MFEPVKQPLVSIVTVNYNSLEETIELLESVFDNSYQNTEVLVVDNASEVDPGEQLDELFPSVKVLRSEENLGFAGGNNLALAHCQGDFIFFVNNDAELTDGVIESLLQLFDEVPSLGIVSPKLCYYNTLPDLVPDVIQYAGTTPVHPLTGRNSTIGVRQNDEGRYRLPEPTAYCHGAAMMVPREVIEKVGPMSEDYFLYYEELDWCERIRKAGYQVYVDNRVKVYHKESISVEKIGAAKTYYLNRNRILFMRRNRKALQLMVFFAFLFFVTIPWNSLKFLKDGEIKNLEAFLSAVKWNFTEGKKMSKPSSHPLTFTAVQ